MRKLDLIGDNFGRLTVVSEGTPERSPSRSHTTWICVCECGAELQVRTNSLRSGMTKSCGCYRSDKLKERDTGRSKNLSEYSSWSHMKYRCNSKSSADYDDYGGRGIKVCDRWNESFAEFLSDMGAKPTPSHSIGRIDNDGDYNKDNCRWETNWQQSRNKRSSVLIEYNGETMVLQDWADRIGIHWVTLYERLQRHPLQVALTSKKGM